MTFTFNNSPIVNFDRNSSFANVSIIGSGTSYLRVDDTGYPFQGTSYGYVTSRPGVSAIDRFPFAVEFSSYAVIALQQRLRSA